jgi:hypothetical protein
VTSRPGGSEPPVVRLERTAALELLSDGEIEIVGRIVGSSNNALYCTVTRRCPDPEPDLVAAAVYKPILGERPLDDFPDGTLAFREVATHELSEASGWGIAPPTVLRDGPFGEGMVQLWIDADPTVDRVALVVDSDPRLRAMALFDAVANNADRKVGHLLPIEDGHIYGVDHGICFSAEPKLRTVLWAWRGEPILEGELEVLTGLRAGLGEELGERLRELLSGAEVTATRGRLDRLLARRRFPQPDPRRPSIPWPPY